MSLLMEALRKAEAAKRRGQSEERSSANTDTEEQHDTSPDQPAPFSRFSLEVREPDTRVAFTADELSQEPVNTEPDSHLVSAQELQTLFTTGSVPEAVAEPVAENQHAASGLARAARHQRAASSVFSAKQRPGKNRNTLKVLLLALAILVPLGAGVLWILPDYTSSSIGINPAVANYDLSTRNLSAENNADSATLAAAANPALTAQVPAQTTSTTTLQATPEEQLASATLATSANTSVDEPVVEPGSDALLVATAEVTEAQVTDLADEPAASTADEPADSSPPQLPAPPANPSATATAVVPPLPRNNPAFASPGNRDLSLPTDTVQQNLQISRSAGKRETNPQLLAAYKQLQNGAYQQATVLYEEVLHDLPNNRDALLGLAQIRSLYNDAPAARELYARVLQINPRDPLALTGLLQSIQPANLQDHENELKLLLERFPDSAPMHFALGNLYASQNRWAEAQSAYFNALLSARRQPGTPVHPDYAFNLAVSLEQLNQKDAALTYYRQAQTLTIGTKPGFDPEQLRNRLTYLEQEQQ